MMRLALLLMLALATLISPALAADIATGDHVVESTAAAELDAWISGRDTGTIDRIEIGSPQTNRRVAAEHAARPFQLTDNTESYHADTRGDTLWIVGASPKGALNGVFRLMDAQPATLANVDQHESPAFRYRIGDHRRTQQPPPGWTEEEQARFYASHYVNVVWGEKFGPPLSYEARRKYGLGLMLEASLPPTPEGTHWGETGHASPWWDAPDNASAIYWWGRHSWYGKVKVVDPFDPVGRQAYLDHFNNLLERNPDTKVMYCIFGDYSWAPNPDSTRVSDGKRYAHGEEETIYEILSLMKEAIGERDVIPAVWMWLLFPKNGKEAFMSELASRGIGVMYNEAGDNDCWTYVRDNFDHLALKQAPGSPGGGSKFGDDFFPLVSLGGTCESVRPAVGLPLPAIGAGKLHRLLDAGIDDFIIWWGSCEGWAYHANMEVLKELIWRPEAFDPQNPRPFDASDGDPLLRDIAARDFGAELAGDVLAFWRAFEAALVDEDRQGEETGLQVYSWYQRTGNYLVFLDAQAMPLVPDVLANKEKVSSLFPWAVKPEPIENFEAVADALEDALLQLDPLIARAEDDAARQRLKSMRRNGWVYLRVLRTQHNHMRALRVMEDARTLPHDAPELKARLLPILADEDANTAATIDLLGEFAPNFYLGGRWDKKDPQRRELEIEKLQRKRDRMRAYARELGAASRITSADAAGGIITLPTARAIQSVAATFDSEAVGGADVELSVDGEAWERVGVLRPTAYATGVARFPATRARFIRLRSADGTSADRATSTDEVAVYAAPLLEDVRFSVGSLQPAFAPHVTRYELVLPPGVASVNIEPVIGAATAVTVDGRTLPEPTSVPLRGDRLQLAASDGEQRAIYEFHLIRNYAIDAAASADSAAEGSGPEFAVDARPVTDADDSRWVSGGGDGPRWLALDLGKPHTVGRAVIRSGYRGGSMLAIEDFRIQTSDDGRTWRDVPATIVEGNRDTVRSLAFQPLTTRHIRLLITKTPNDIARVYEFELYAPAAGSPPPADPTE